jgi:8-oxo-dGTP pyrophosphatase MutT (NUDIX family)
MAESNFHTQQYTSDDFVESCGAVVFDLSDASRKRVCLSNIIAKNEWVFAKGRRNIDESRKDAALREFHEETGYRCKLLPVDMRTRATAADEPPDAPDMPLVHRGLTEPFMCTVRNLPGESGVKIIWWFIAELDGIEAGKGLGEEDLRSEFFDFEEAVEKPWFKTDRKVLRRAIEIVEDTLRDVHGIMKGELH